MELFLSDIHMILKPIFAPPGLILFLFLIGLIFYYHLLGKLLTWLTLIALYLLSVPAGSQWLAKSLEVIPPVTPDQLLQQQAEAILILGAGHSGYSNDFDDNPRLSGSAIQRIVYAANLHRATNLPLMFAGGLVGNNTRPSAELAADWLRTNMDIEVAWLETRSQTTWQNAAFSKLLMHEHAIKKVAVVTHAAHMRRAMQTMRAHGIEAIAAPFGYFSKTSKADDDAINWLNWQPKSWALSHNLGLLHEHIGSFWYRIKEMLLP